MVRDPRGVPAELGFELLADVEIAVCDASAESLCMVLPRRPEGSQDLDEPARAALVSRNGLIGVAPV